MHSGHRDLNNEHRILLQCIQSPVVALVADFSISFCNEAFAKIIGKGTAEEIEQTNILEISSEFENSTFFHLVEEIFNTSQSKSQEIFFNGRYFYSDLYPTPWGAIAVLNDITDRKIISEKLKKTEKKIEVLIDSTDDIIVQTDLNGNHLYRNKAFYEGLGFKETDDVELDGFSRVHPEDISRLKENITSLMEKGITTSEYRVRNKKGKWISQHAKSVVLYENDRPTSILSIIRDVTKLRRIEKELGESEARFRNLIEQFPSGIVVHSRDGGIIYGNQAARGFWGVTDELYQEILTNYNILNDEQLEKSGLIPIIKRGFAGETVSLPSILYTPDIETTSMFPKTKRKWVQSQLFPIIDEKGEVSEVVHFINDISEQKRIEEILRKERDTAQQYLDIVPVIMLAINHDQKVILINRVGCETLGFLEHEILGKNWFNSFIPPVSREKVRTAFQDLMKGNLKYMSKFENTIETKDGELRDISWYNTILTNEKGIIIGTLSSGQDITEQKQAEQALRESEEKFRRLVSSSPEGIWVTDKRDITTFVNPALENMLGYTQQDLCGHPVTNFLDTSSVSKFRSISQERFRDKTESSSYELTFLRKDGSTLITRVSGRLLFDTKNEITGSFAILSDITAKKRAEDFLLKARDYLSEQVEKRTSALNREKLRIETIVETIPAGIVVINSKLEFILVNKKFHEFYEKIYKIPLPKFLNEVLILKNKFGDTISKVFYSKEDVTSTIEPLKGFHLELASSQVISQPDTHIGVVIVVRDVTPFVEIDNLRKQFVSTVSHELRTPITGISLSLQNLTRYWDKFSEIEKLSLIETMSFSSDVLTQMVEDLLMVSRIEAGRFNLRWQKINLRKIVKKVLIQMDSKRAEREIVINSNIPSKIEFLGDGKRLSQVFRILLDNAFKYSKRRSNVRIEVLDHYSGEFNEKAVDGILIEFIDSGKGIPEKDLPYVFDRYFRSENILEIPGSGVGLDIAKTIIESHNGEIHVRSEFGYGTVVSIFIPRVLNVKDVIDN